MASDNGISIGYNEHAIISSEAQNDDHADDDVTTQNGDHMTQNDDHVTYSDGDYIEELVSDEDTAGEGGEETLPQDSTTSPATTDALNDPLDPIDFIETRPHSHAHCFNGAVDAGRGVLRTHTASGIHYENLSGLLVEMDESTRKGDL